MRAAALAFAALLLIAATAHSPVNEPGTTYDDHKVDAALSIARLYGLSRDQAMLMLAIRDHESGYAAEKEFGIEGQPRMRDERMRFCRNACICARLIKRYCPDAKRSTVRRFNHGYDDDGGKYLGYAEDAEWWLKVLRHKRKYENILYH